MRNLMIMAIILLLACNREAPQPTDPLDLLPPATQTGENTLGFLLDGEPWTPNRLFQGDYRKSDGAFGLSCENAAYDNGGTYKGSRFIINYSQNLFGEGTYRIKELPHSKGLFLSAVPLCDFVTTDNSLGILEITRFDTSSRVIAGTFQFSLIGEGACMDTISITEGRFDVSF